MKGEMTAPEYSATIDRLMPEKELQEFVRQAALRFNWLFYHTHDSRFSPSGFPDCVMVRGDRLIFAELKRQSEKALRPAQEEWCNAIYRFAKNVSKGVEYYLWRPSDRDSILEVLA